MKRFALAAVATLGGFAVAAACGEPYEGESPNITPPTREAGIDADAPAEDASDDAALVADAGDAGDAGSDADPCDRDRDGFRDEADACGGNDCDDDDGRAHPDAGFVSTAPTTKTNGDFDCDGIVTKQFLVNVSCGALSSCPPQGFSGNPPCGGASEYVQCKGSSANCTVGTSEIRTQGCK